LQLWDEAACEALLAGRYPWFLPTWRAYNTTVLKSGGAPAGARGSTHAAHVTPAWQTKHPLPFAHGLLSDTFQLVPTRPRQHKLRPSHPIAHPRLSTCSHTACNIFTSHALLPCDAADAIRPFILHAHGGLYLDLDTECLADAGPALEGADIVLMAEVGGPGPGQKIRRVRLRAR
jgi:hypothetical protein